MATIRPLPGTTWPRRLTLAAMALILLVAALLPQGTMPIRSAQGGLLLVLCTGEGPVQALFDPATGETRPVPQDSDHDRCTWACGQMQLAAETPLPLPSPLWQLAATLDLPAPASGAPVAETIAPSARGPPRLA